MTENQPISQSILSKKIQILYAHRKADNKKEKMRGEKNLII